MTAVTRSESRADRVQRVRGEASPSLPWPTVAKPGEDGDGGDSEDEGDEGDEGGAEGGLMARIDSIGPAPAGLPPPPPLPPHPHPPACRPYTCRPPFA